MARDALRTLASPPDGRCRVSRAADSLTPSRRMDDANDSGCTCQGARAIPLLPRGNTGLKGNGFAMSENPGAAGTTNSWACIAAITLDNNSPNEFMSTSGGDIELGDRQQRDPGARSLSLAFRMHAVGLTVAGAHSM